MAALLGVTVMECLLLRARVYKIVILPFLGIENMHVAQEMEKPPSKYNTPCIPF